MGARQCAVLSALVPLPAVLGICGRPAWSADGRSRLAAPGTLAECDQRKAPPLHDKTHVRRTRGSAGPLGKSRSGLSGLWQAHPNRQSRVWMLKRDNVDLITDPIDRIVPEGVRT